MNDTLVAFSTAVLAKRKGFSMECDSSFSKDGEFLQGIKSSNLFSENPYLISVGLNNDDISVNDLIAAPTQTQLSNWLRKRHKIIPELRVSKYSRSSDADITYEGRVVRFNDKPYTSNLRRVLGFEECLEETLYSCLMFI